MLALATLVGCLTHTHSSDACSPPPPGVGLTVPNEIPANGVLPLRVYCYDCTEPLHELSVTVRLANSEAVEGAILQSAFSLYDGELVWISEEQPSPGVELEVTVSVGTKEASAKVTVGPTLVPVTPPQPKVELRAYAYAALEGESACCEDGVMDSCGGISCYLIAEDAKLISTLYVDIDEDDGTQFIYSATLTEPDQTRTRDRNSSGSIGFDTDLNEGACVKVVAEHARSHEAFEVFEDCVDDSLFEFPDLKKSIEENNLHLFEQCTQVKEEHEELWCATFHEALVSGSCEGFPTSACQAALAACPPNDPNDRPDGSGGRGETLAGGAHSGGADSGGTGTDEGGAASGGAQTSSGGSESGPGGHTATGGSADDTAGPAPSGRGGCSLGRTSDSNRWMLWMTFPLLFFRRRRGRGFALGRHE